MHELVPQLVPLQEGVSDEELLESEELDEDVVLSVVVDALAALVDVVVVDVLAACVVGVLPVLTLLLLVAGVL